MRCSGAMNSGPVVCFRLECKESFRVLSCKRVWVDISADRMEFSEHNAHAEVVSDGLRSAMIRASESRDLQLNESNKTALAIALGLASSFLVVSLSSLGLCLSSFHLSSVFVQEVGC